MPQAGGGGGGGLTPKPETILEYQILVSEGSTEVGLGGSALWGGEKMLLLP